MNAHYSNRIVGLVVTGALSGYPWVVWAELENEPRATGKSTEVVRDQIEKKKVGDKTIYVQSVEVKNTSAEEISIRVTSHPWSKPDKWKKGEDRTHVVGPDGNLVPADPVPGRFGARQERKDIKIASGKSATVTFEWDEQWKYRYTDIYLKDVKAPDSATFNVFAVSLLSPWEDLRIPVGRDERFAAGQTIPYPYAVFGALGGGPTRFKLTADGTSLPEEWSLGFDAPRLDTGFELDIVRESLDLDISLIFSEPARPGQEGFFSYYLVQPDLGYRYHVFTRVRVVPEPTILWLIGIAWVGLYSSVRGGARRRAGSCAAQDQ